MSRAIMSVFSQQSPAVELRTVPRKGATADRTAAPRDAENDKPGIAGAVCTKLGKTLIFKGDLWADEEVLLLGSVEGSIECSEPLTVDLGGRVIGDVRGRSITIKGTVLGNIRGTESVVVAPGGTVTGDIVAPRVTIIEGAHVNGTVRMMTAECDAVDGVTAAGDRNGIVLGDAAVEKLLGLLNSSGKN